MTYKISIVGIVGIPSKYGGFETLAENLVKYQSTVSLSCMITVYCSNKSYPSKVPSYLGARLKYLPFRANGAQSVIYDAFSILSSTYHRSDVILLLGVSGAIVLPFVRLLSTAHIVTNIDGIEWKRAKWHGLAKAFLRFSESVAIHFSHAVISDNAAIYEYIKHTYAVDSHIIAYGGDHALAVESVAVDEYELPDKYALSVCRIEPENNIHIILEAFSKMVTHNLVMVGNWDNSDYGRMLRKQYALCENLFMLDPNYDMGKLKTMRSQSSFYVHGHSAGGTNPSLVEAMHFGKAIIAFDCNYNRSTTEDKALYFHNSEKLQELINTMDMTIADKIGLDMVEIANRRYTWCIVAKQYFSLLTNNVSPGTKDADLAV